MLLNPQPPAPTVFRATIRWLSSSCGLANLTLERQQALTSSFDTCWSHKPASILEGSQSHDTDRPWVPSMLRWLCSDVGQAGYRVADQAAIRGALLAWFSMLRANELLPAAVKAPREGRSAQRTWLSSRSRLRGPPWRWWCACAALRQTSMAAEKLC